MQEDAGALRRGNVALFDDRYGHGAYDRLCELLAQPCVSFAAIGVQFGVSRERVRQWHEQFLPDAPSGRERRRQCFQRAARRRLLDDPLVHAFVRSVRTHESERQVGLLPARDGYRRRVMLLGDERVALRKARRRRSYRGQSEQVEFVTGRAHAVDFVFYHIAGDDFLFVPSDELPAVGTTFTDGRSSRYAAYRRSFRALYRVQDAARPAAVRALPEALRVVSEGDED